MRLLLWFGFGAIAHRECYMDAETYGKEARRNHPIEARYRWLTMGILVTEILIAYKYRRGTGHISDDPTPWYIWMPWSFGILFCIGFWMYLRLKPDHSIKYPGYVPSWSQHMGEGNVSTTAVSP